jgi:four helix bundle protein
MRDFKRLEVWRRAHALAIAIDEISADFRRSRHGHLRSQLTRAADSIAANIAEGCGSQTKRELARYLDIAIKSATETENHLIKARDLGLISQADWLRYSNETIEIRKMAYAYRKRVLQSDKA